MTQLPTLPCPVFQNMEAPVPPQKEWAPRHLSCDDLPWAPSGAAASPQLGGQVLAGERTGAPGVLLCRGVCQLLGRVGRSRVSSTLNPRHTQPPPCCSPREPVEGKPDLLPEPQAFPRAIIIPLSQKQQVSCPRSPGEDRPCRGSGLTPQATALRLHIPPS